MNTKFCVLVLLVVCIASFVSAKPQGDLKASTDCGENEEYTTCGNVCPKRCVGGLPFCSLRCFIGCRCKSGYVLNKENKCVLQEDC
ncbi:chymotrypsin inhibitor-like [Bactrocera tryoni]|uniref:chymotrypsin inhibitor-like n=1 Tax=Bactrocera tryoni TaxID=59916 RepID=UPI001A96C4C4|nr:chymotrypsin inhibitor-like [Bactrocera tryoni]XP_039953523.1 chymotrypsin inhibitor-like [Bactrocera tryoni]